MVYYCGIPIENHCILFVLKLNTYSLVPFELWSMNIYISLVIRNDKHFVTFFREGVKKFLSHSDSFVDISFDTYMPIFKFLALANSSINSNKQTDKKKPLTDGSGLYSYNVCLFIYKYNYIRQLPDIRLVTKYI